MTFNVIIGPAAISYQGSNGHTYWVGYTGGNQSTGIPRRSTDKAIKDAEKLERRNYDRANSNTKSTSSKS